MQRCTKSIEINDTLILEPVDPYNQDHILFIKQMNDFRVKYKYLWNLKKELHKIRKNPYRHPGTSYLMKHNHIYEGYLWMSDIDIEEQAVTLSYGIQKKMRNHGLGTYFISSISEYLLYTGIALHVDMWIKKKNTSSQKVAEHCGFDLYSQQKYQIQYRKSKIIS